jgi:diguanylate cyclase (GGDEF)-like protein
VKDPGKRAAVNPHLKVSKNLTNCNVTIRIGSGICQIGSSMTGSVTKMIRCKTAAMVKLGTLALIGALWCGIALQACHELDETVQVAIERNRNIAVAFEQYAIRTIQAADAITDIVKNAVERGRHADPIQELNDAGIIDAGVYQGVGLVDASGTVVRSTFSPQYHGPNVSDREHFWIHKWADLGLFIGKPIISAALNEPSIPISRRINNPDGSFGGAVVVQISPKKLTDFYQSASLSGTSYISLRGSDGVIRARRLQNEETSGQTLAGSVGYREQQYADSGSVLTPGYGDGIPRYMSFRRLRDYPLIVTVGISRAEVLAPTYRRIQIYVFVGAAVSLSLLILSLALGQAFDRRDQALETLTEREDELKKMATLDVVTGLPNRACFDQRADVILDQASRAGQSVAFYFIDLDNFKTFNDTFGHAFGDEVLCAVARDISEGIGSGDFAGRLGGDEFVVVRPVGTGSASAETFADVLRQGLEAPRSISGRDVSLSASVGICIAPQRGRTRAELVRASDEAMYNAKRNDRGSYRMYTPDLGLVADRRMKLEQRLRLAVHSADIEVHYQPQVDLRSGEAIGVEALARWTDHELGPVSPAEFIPVAESSGLILEIGAQVARRACHEVVRWRNRGVNIRLAINVSPLQFRQPEIVEMMRAIIAESGIPTTALELELTETMIVGAPEEVARRLADLKALGVRLSLDDFGTGYSNLQYLRKFPIDAIKIDRAFVSDVTNNPDCAAITKAIIGLGRDLNLDVVAEGIEDPTQAVHLVREGCQIGQGFAYSRPMPGPDCLQWLIARRNLRRLPLMRA